jgi:hypothetical protein
MAPFDGGGHQGSKKAALWLWDSDRLPNPVLPPAHPSQPPALTAEHDHQRKGYKQSFSSHPAAHLLALGSDRLSPGLLPRQRTEHLAPTFVLHPPQLDLPISSLGRARAILLWIRAREVAISWRLVLPITHI